MTRRSLAGLSSGPRSLSPRRPAVDGGLSHLGLAAAGVGDRLPGVLADGLYAAALTLAFCGIVIE